MKDNPTLPMRTIQVALGIVFGVLLVASVLVLLIRGGGEFVPVVTILAGALVVSIALPMVQEFSIGPKGITGKLQKLQDDVDLLTFLVGGYVTSFELKHLKALAGDGPFGFDRRESFVDELRRLWQLGLIEKVRSDWYLASLPAAGNLKEFLAITERGRCYLRFLDDLEASEPVQAGAGAVPD